MGNIGSQIANSSNKYKIEPTNDAHQRLSLPRIGQNQQQKVLPVSKEPRPKLRSTENGKILHSGGTLSGRHQESRISRGNFMNVKEKVNLLKELQECNKANLLRQHRDEQLKKFGSEPDLRVRLRREKASNFMPKKYDDWMIRRRESQLNGSDRQNDTNCNTRRIGLFKTRVESNKRNNNNSPGPVRRNKLLTEEKTDDITRLHMPEVQKEVPITAERLETDQYAPNSNIIPAKHTREENINGNCDLYLNEENHMKKYYFGMENKISAGRLDYRIEDCRPEDILRNLITDTDCSDQSEITLNLRPILPKKQLEIPRFSSSLAWKLLYSLDSDSNLDRSSANNTEDDQFLVEERIAPLSPSRLSKSLDFQFSQDKSGDSGISGDETPKPPMTWSQYYKSKQSWTPQQDLDDESSTDDEGIKRFNSVPYYTNNNEFNVNKPHIFSLSLPRDHFTNQYALEKYKNHLKRSASGMLSNGNDLDALENRCSIKNSNWLLSKSAPNSLNNGFASLDSGNCMQNGASSFLVVQGKGRIMYLPQGNTSMGNVSTGAKNDEASPLPENLVREVERKERQRLKEVEAMQRIEEEFRRKRARYNGLYTNNQQDFRKALFTTGEKSV